MKLKPQILETEVRKYIFLLYTIININIFLIKKGVTLPDLRTDDKNVFMQEIDMRFCVFFCLFKSNVKWQKIFFKVVQLCLQYKLFLSFSFQNFYRNIFHEMYYLQKFYYINTHRYYTQLNLYKTLTYFWKHENFTHFNNFTKTSM